MRKVSDHQWEMRARGPVSLDPVGSVNAVKLREKWDVRLRCAKSRMPIVCKALEIERWRWLTRTSKRRLVNLGSCSPTHLSIATTAPQGINTSDTFSLIPKRYKGAFDSSTTFENVHHANEPHILGSTKKAG